MHIPTQEHVDKKKAYVQIELSNNLKPLDYVLFFNVFLKKDLKSCKSILLTSNTESVFSWS